MWLILPLCEAPFVLKISSSNYIISQITCVVWGFRLAEEKLNSLYTGELNKGRRKNESCDLSKVWIFIVKTKSSTFSV